MCELCGTYKVLYNGVPVGNLTVDTVGLYTRFSAECAAVGSGVLRLYIQCKGLSIPLGVAIPNGTSLQFERKLSANDLRTLGITSIDRVTLQEAGAPKSSWQTADRLESLLCPPLASVCEHLPGTITNSENGQSLLAFPIDCTLPFPIVPAFKLCSVRTIDGNDYFVFCLKDGEPE